MKTRALLHKLKSDVEVISDTVKTDFYSLSDEILNWKASPEQWSILECVEHLNRYSTYYHQAIENAIKKSPSDFKDEPVQSTWMGKKSIAMMHPSNIKKQKTFKYMNPANSKLNRNILDVFLQNQQHLLGLLTQSEACDVNAARVPLEFFKLIKIKLAETLEFLVVHEQRHLLQMQNIKSQIRSKKHPVLAL